LIDFSNRKAQSKSYIKRPRGGRKDKLGTSEFRNPQGGPNFVSLSPHSLLLFLFYFAFHGGLSFKGWFHCNFIIDSDVRMNKFVCSFDSCYDLFSSISFDF